MSEFDSVLDPDWDWRDIPEEAKEKAEAHLREQGFDGVNIYKLAKAEPQDSDNDNHDMPINTPPAEIVAVARVWVAANAILTFWDLDEIEFTLLLMYGLGHREAVAKMFLEIPGVDADYLFQDDAHLVFAYGYNKLIDGKMESSKRAELKRKKQLEADGPLYTKRDDTICKLFDEVKNQPGSPSRYAGKVAREYNKYYCSKYPPFDPTKKRGDESRCGRPLSIRHIKNILVKRGKIPKPGIK